MPNVVLGIFLNITTGLFVQHIRADLLVVMTSILAALSPLLMAIIDPAWSWWSCAFWAVLLVPVSVDGETPPATHLTPPVTCLLLQSQNQITRFEALSRDTNLLLLSCLHHRSPCCCRRLSA